MFCNDLNCVKTNTKEVRKLSYGMESILSKVINWVQDIRATVQAKAQFNPNKNLSRVLSLASLGYIHAPWCFIHIATNLAGAM